MGREATNERVPPFLPIALGLCSAVAAGLVLVQPALVEADRADAESERLLAVTASGESAARASVGLRRQRDALIAELSQVGRVAARDVHRIEGCGEFAEFWSALARFEQDAVIRRLEIVRDPSGEEVRFEADVDRLVTAAPEVDQ